MDNKKIIKELVELQADVAKSSKNLGLRTLGDLDYMLLLTKSRRVLKKRTYLEIAENFKIFISKHFEYNKNFTERINNLIDEINNSELSNLTAFGNVEKMSSLEIELGNYRIATLLNSTK